MPFVISKLYQLTHVWMNSSNGVHDIKNIRETYDIFATHASRKTCYI